MSSTFTHRVRLISKGSYRRTYWIAYLNVLMGNGVWEEISTLLLTLGRGMAWLGVAGAQK